MKLLYVSILFVHAFSSCFQPGSSCDSLSEDNFTTLIGSMNINSKGKFVFEIKGDTSPQKIILQPCDQGLQDYIANLYDSFLYLKKSEEQFWLRVDGQYQAPVDSNETVCFLFNFVAWLEEDGF